MRILTACLGYWHDREMSNYNTRHPAYRLPAWESRMRKCFSPVGLFIASGTFSDPVFNPIPEAVVVNAGALFDKPYEGNYRHYGKCAFTAGLAYALNRQDWDLLVWMDTDGLFGDINLDTLLMEFAERGEILLAPGWHSYPGGPMTVMKRDGASRMLHYRQTSNLRDSDEGVQIIWEKELAYIFRNGRWWNPWPQFLTCRNDGTGGRHIWPMVACLPDEEVDAYLADQGTKTKPLLP